MPITSRPQDAGIKMTEHRLLPEGDSYLFMTKRFDRTDINQSGRWYLAPASNLCYSYNPAGSRTKRHQMSANSKQDRFAVEYLQKVAEKMGIKKGKKIIEEVVESATTRPEEIQ